MNFLHSEVEKVSDGCGRHFLIEMEPLNSEFVVNFNRFSSIVEEQLNKQFYFDVKFTSNSEDLIVLVMVGLFPLEDSILWNCSLGPSHLDPVVLIFRVVDFPLPEPIDESWSI